MSTEEKIKQAFERQAGRAGDHRRVLAGVRKATSRKRRIGAVGVTVITAGVAAAILLPIVVFPGREQPTDPDTVMAEPIHPKPAEHASAGTPVLKYHPGWLPDGAYERDRYSRPDGYLARTWRVSGGSGPDKATVTLALDKTATQSHTPGTNTVDVNGTPALLSSPDAAKADVRAMVSWPAAPDQLLVVRVDSVPNARQTALMIARSVRADGDAAFERPLSFDWLPPNTRLGNILVSGRSQSDFTALVETRDDARPAGQRALTAQVGGRRPDGGVAVTVRGGQGRYVPVNGDKFGDLYVELTPGRWLVVSGPLSQQDLVRVADGIRIGPLTFPWLGTR